MSEFDNFS